MARGVKPEKCALREHLGHASIFPRDGPQGPRGAAQSAATKAPYLLKPRPDQLLSLVGGGGGGILAMMLSSALSAIIWV